MGDAEAVGRVGGAGSGRAGTKTVGAMGIGGAATLGASDASLLSPCGRDVPV
jgi:hypothetical protein